jgi:hypothetical protein
MQRLFLIQFFSTENPKPGLDKQALMNRFTGGFIMNAWLTPDFWQKGAMRERNIPIKNTFAKGDT